MSGSEVTLGETSRRYSLLPAGFSLKAIGIGKKDPAVGNPPEKAGENSDGMASLYPDPPKSMAVAGSESNTPRPGEQLTRALGSEPASQHYSPMFVEAARVGPKTGHVSTELEVFEPVDILRGPLPVAGARMGSDSASALNLDFKPTIKASELVSSSGKALEVWSPIGVGLFARLQVPLIIINQANQKLLAKR